MQIRLICVGKLKEKYWQDAVKEYLKRLTSYAKVEIVEVPEERIQENASMAEIQQALVKEGEYITRQILPNSYVILLAIQGKMLPSEKLAEFMGQLTLEGKSKVVFIIGSSHGIAQEIQQKSDYLLSFSPMTFPHQLMRVVLLEQIYRSFKILKGEPYHK